MRFCERNYIYTYCGKLSIWFFSDIVIFHIVICCLSMKFFKNHAAWHNHNRCTSHNDILYFSVLFSAADVYLFQHFSTVKQRFHCKKTCDLPASRVMFSASVNLYSLKCSFILGNKSHSGLNYSITYRIIFATEWLLICISVSWKTKNNSLSMVELTVFITKNAVTNVYQ